MTKILGLTGPSKAGKDTTADILIQSGIIKQKFAFADPLKSICSLVFSLDKELFYNQSLKEQNFSNPIELTAAHGLQILELCSEYVDSKKFNSIIRFDDLIGTKFNTPRYLLQFIGSELIRQRFYDKFHVHACLANIPQDNNTYAITDIRYINEFEFLKENFENSKFYYIERPQAEENRKLSTHMSEKEMDLLKTKVNFVIKNDSTIDSLKDLVIKMFSE